MEIIGMHRLLVAISFAVAFAVAHGAAAQSFEVILDGESFTNKFVADPPNGNKLIEFVRSSETFDNWTKLVGFRYQQMPGADNDPSKVAIGMANILKARGMMSAVTENKKLSEAMIDFIASTKNGVQEFNVFRYARSNDGKAVVSLQFAYRFTDTSESNIPKILKLRESWIKQAAAFDIRVVHDALAQ
jgi:hypothetical protein